MTAIEEGMNKAQIYLAFAFKIFQYADQFNKIR